MWLMFWPDAFTLALTRMTVSTFARMRARRWLLLWSALSGGLGYRGKRWFDQESLADSELGHMMSGEQEDFDPDRKPKLKEPL